MPHAFMKSRSFKVSTLWIENDGGAQEGQNWLPSWTLFTSTTASFPQLGQIIS